MNWYGLYKSINMLIGLGLLVLGGLTACIYFAGKEISHEMSFRHQYGDHWRAEFEQTYGPVADSHIKVAVGTVGVIAIPVFLFYIFKAMRPDWQKDSGSQSRRRSGGDSRSHRFRCRRNAVICMVSGLAGIAIGVAFVLFRWGIFADHADEVTLGLVVYLGGYAGVIAGCWWWLKAKAWTEAVAFIGLMPVAMIFIPFVRLILLASPLLLPMTMGMMALILIGVVLVLPDKSGADGHGGRRRRGRWHDDH